MSRRNKRTYLWDMLDAATSIKSFTADKTLEDYEADRVLRRAVEREFEIVGEALNQAQQRFPELKEEITDYATIIAFRNRLIHAYPDIRHSVVWAIIENDLPLLISEVEALLEAENQGQLPQDET